MRLISSIRTWLDDDVSREAKDELRRQRGLAQRAADAARSRVLDELSKSVLADLRRRGNT